MEKTIYQLLNEVETDFTEYEQTELSSREMEQYKQKILMEVRGMKANKRKNANRRTLKAVAGMAAALVLVIIVAGVANPVSAKELLVNAFGKLSESVRGEEYEKKEDTEKYTRLGENAANIQEEIAKCQGDESYVTTAESHGVKISISDIYCDGYVLYYTATLNTDNEKLNQADGIVTDVRTGAVGDEKFFLDGMELEGWGWTRSPFQKVKDGSFVLADQINFLSAVADGSDPGQGENGTVVVDWTIEKLVGKLWDRHDDRGEYAETESVEGTWHLRFPVTIDRTKAEVIPINKEENGILIKNATKTKVGLIVEVDYSGYATKPPYNYEGAPTLGIKDSEGEYLQWLDESYEQTFKDYIMVLYDGQKDLCLEVIENSEDAPDGIEKIAEIPFQLP